ncbi:uncharacterized protein LOC133187306 [Saccostrea echinata]|uniref:uncharacterized protein LOC133187306 n=1 Tax=Saccostrea echinata TaxID=191078 RepID=UPI002A8085F4|nr:uncharacterized protein LOC133187306 [Saccostrea echinata]
MGIKERLIDTPLFLKISCVLVIAAFVINLIAFSVPYWFELKKYHEGLWSICIGSECTDYSLKNLTSWFEASRMFAVFGFIGSIATIVLLVLYIFVEKLSIYIVYIAAVVTCFVTGGFILLLVLIYGAFLNNLSWGWAFCVVAFLLYTVAGVLLIVNFLRKDGKVASK